MSQLFDNHTTLLSRHYQSEDNGLAIVTIDELSVTVPAHPFWEKFAQGWEPDTERIYQSAVSRGSTVLDIGAWIGPTILFALACGATRIIALEPNPVSFSLLQKIIELNPEFRDNVFLQNQAISDKRGMLKMGLVEGETDTSTFGIQGNTIEIETTTICNLIRDYDLDTIDLIKIDIEGAEALLSRELTRLSHRKKQKIHLSIHVPFFPDSADKLVFAETFKHFTIFDDRGEQLSYKTLADRILTEQTHLHWGTRHGNFFEVLLIAN